MPEAPIRESGQACFTGHRPSKFPFGYDESSVGCLAIKRCLAEAVETLFASRGVNSFISGMALGVDTWAAEAVVAARQEHPGIRLLAAVPCQGQDSRWPEHARRRYQNLLDLSDRVEVLSEDPYAPWQMMARDRWMVDRSGFLVAVFDGSPGGTAHTHAYAKKQGLPILRVRSEDGSWEDASLEDELPPEEPPGIPGLF